MLYLVIIYFQAFRPAGALHLLSFLQVLDTKQALKLLSYGWIITRIDVKHIYTLCNAWDSHFSDRIEDNLVKIKPLSFNQSKNQKLLEKFAKLICELNLTVLR